MPSVTIKKIIHELREIALLGFCTIALLFTISLVTFNIEDAGWTHSGSGPMQMVHNACGTLGAWVADFVLSIFGLMAYLLPAIFLWHGYMVYTNKQHYTKLILVLRWLGFIATTVSGSAIFYLHILRVQHIELPRNTGGIVGQEVGNVLLIILGNSGATLLLSAILLAGITLFTGLSWIVLLDFVGKYTIKCFNVMYQWCALVYRFHKDKNPMPLQVKNTHPQIIKHSKVKIVPTINAEEPYNYVENLESMPEDMAFAETLHKDKLPSVELLDKHIVSTQKYSAKDLEEISRQVENILQDFNVLAKVVAINTGPVITRFELQLAAGIKVSRVNSLDKDIARELSVTSVRIVEIIKGKSVIGLEIPNRECTIVPLRDLISSRQFVQAKSKLTFAMGKDIAGIPVISDLGKMPHVLIAGTTGSGKSVAINTMICSLLYKATANEVRMIMIDPKMLELSVYDGIPHLLTPVVTDMKNAKNALCWAVAEMERRYKLMSKLGVRNLAGYNLLIEQAESQSKPIKDPLFSSQQPLAEGEEFPVLDKLPSIVIIIDELADMMMIVGKKVEELIARLAQKARASGIHLVLATQRPSVDVLTGLIKANVPTRISFQVSSRIDSRTILDQSGAESLLGNGDMLFLPSGTNIPSRVHGAFVDDYEVHKIVAFIKTISTVNYMEEITLEPSDTSGFITEREENLESDPLYDEVVLFVTDSRKASISSVQRHFKVGYNRAARMIEAMENSGVVSSPEGNGFRQVLAPAPVKD